MTTLSLNDEIYNGLVIEAKKQNRSAANLAETILLKNGIKKLSDQEREKSERRLEVSA